MIKRLFRFIGATFRFLLLGLDIFRRVLINLIFLLVLGGLLVWLWPATPTLPERAALVLEPSGALVEQRQLDAPLDLLRPGASAAAQTSLHDLVRAVRAARDDERIEALIIDTDELSGSGLSKLAELRAAIVDFRTSGKPVLSRGERFTQEQYYLASAADEVHMSPDGFVLFNGLSRYVTYFKEALDNLGVTVHVVRAGEYKSFSEPFTRTDMSQQDRDSSADLLAGVWSMIRDDVAGARNLSPEALDDYVLGFTAHLVAENGNAAMAAQQAGLVDQLSTRDQWRALLRQRLGGEQPGADFSGVSAQRYLAGLEPSQRPQGRVAVLVAEGAIMDGAGTAGVVGGERFARRIREAREDPSVAALVVRIDSPGGSAWASEQIRRELEITRRAGKPVVASLSSTAASGGYWAAVGADEIWAHPLTLTGSIGVFAMLPEFSGTLDRLGLHTDGVATGPFAGAIDPRRPLSNTVREALEAGVDHAYRRFIDTVAEARAMNVAEVELAAEGRVWTGEAAHKIGLVDELGGLQDAIAAAAARAGLDAYVVHWPEQRLSPRAVFMQKLSEWVLPEHNAQTVNATAPLGRLLARVHNDAQALLHWNDPQHLYVHCLCEAP